VDDDGVVSEDCSYLNPTAQRTDVVPERGQVQILSALVV
jgi:hypothetical protein